MKKIGLRLAAILFCELFFADWKKKIVIADADRFKSNINEKVRGKFFIVFNLTPIFLSFHIKSGILKFPWNVRSEK